MKGRDTKFDTSIHESRSASYITKANSGLAIVDKLLRQKGLVPLWEIDQEIVEDGVLRIGKVYLKDIMGVRDTIDSTDVDYLIRFNDLYPISSRLNILH